MDYKVGDLVLIKSQDNIDWVQGMDKNKGRAVRISRIYNLGSSKCFGSSDFVQGTSVYSYDIRNIEKIYDLDIDWVNYNKDLEKKATAIEKDEKVKSIGKKDEIYKICCDIFGEDVVDVNGSENEYNIAILFPEIHITNSRNNKHTIYDLVVYFFINYHPTMTGRTKASIRFCGTRLTMTREECYSQYGHSHLPGGSIQQIDNFCLGSSEFGVLISQCSLECTQLLWEMMFMSLPSYLSWESLEGGPYRCMKDISAPSARRIDERILNSEFDNIMKGLDSECLTTTDGVSLVLISDDDKLMEKIDALVTIKNINNSSFSNERDGIEDLYITFKGKKIYRKVIQKQEKQQEKIDKATFSYYKNRISIEILNFNKNTIYDNYRSKNFSSTFGKVGTFK